MNLTSCDGCGVVLDKDKLNFPKDDEMYDRYGDYSRETTMWDGNNFAPFVACPVCSTPILKSK